MRNRIGNQEGRKVAMAALLVALFAWGCDGNNLFGPGVGFGPQIITLTTPESVASGEAMGVGVRAVGLVRVDSIVTTARGGEFNFRRVSLSQNGETDLTVAVSFDIPRPITDTLVIVQATAYDAQGNASLPKIDTVRVFDTTAPTVQTTLGGPTVGQGKTLGITVAATDNIKLTYLGYRVLNSDSVVVAADSVAASGKQATRAFSYAVPLDLPLGAYWVEGFARDGDGNRGATLATSTVQVIFIDEERPVVTIQLPGANQNVGVGDTLRVRARVTDNDGIDSIQIRGVAFRGDPNLGTFQEVARFGEWNFRLQNPAADTTLTRILQPTADSTAEAARIIFTAWDRQGNRAADTVVVQLRADEDPPTVDIFNPTVGATLPKGDSILVQAHISDANGLVRSGVRTVRFEGVAFRGDQSLGTFAAVPRFVPREVQLSPPVITQQAISRFMVPTADTTTETVHFIVTAIDGWGNTAADTVAVNLSGDGTVPTITFFDPTPGAGMPTGDSILVRARVQSGEGIASVTYDGVAHRGDRDLGTHVEVQRYSPRTVNFNPPVSDTVLTRFLTATAQTQSEMVYIRAVATDARGRVDRDSVLITVGGPRVELPDLLPTQNVSSGQQVQIRVTATDPTGVEQIILEIEPPAGQPTPVTNPASPFSVTPAQTSVAVDFTWDVPPGTTGTFTVRARARNTNGIFGSAPSVQLVVSTGGVTDTTPPTVRVIPEFFGSSFDPARMEVTDSIRLSITGQDNAGGAGVIEAGYAVRVVPRSRPADTLFVGNAFVRGAPASGVWTHPFTFTVGQLVAGNPAILNLLQTPDTLDLDIFGWMRDAATPTQNCGATVSATTPQSLACVPGPNGTTLADGQSGLRRTISVVSGQTVRLPAGGSIADAVVDTTDNRRRLYLSNIALSRLEVFDVNTNAFLPPVLVGAEPWGLTFNRQNNAELLVANSGGTNLSFVNLTSLNEIEDRRIFTPNALLFNVEERISQAGGLTWEVSPPFDFSDRPQFVAMDINGRIVYSTRPTGTAPDGTIRVAQLPADPQNRVEVTLFTDYALLPPSDGFFAVSNITRALGGPSIAVETHQPFTPRTAPPVTLSSATYTAVGGTALAVDDLAAQVAALAPTLPPVFRPRYRAGQRWNVDAVGLQDTTFVAASGIGNVIAIGEGATATTGRVILWDAATLSPSGAISVFDLVGNASERVLGLAMNHDGRMGAARGLFAAYFFDRDLRLQGTVPVTQGGAGIALHPLHTVGDDGTQPGGSRLAFIPTGQGAIDIFDTFNFARLGRVYVRDPVVGPLRAVLPYADENPAGCLAGAITVAGFTYQGVNYTTAADNCIVVKLVGATAGGGVAVVNVTVADVKRIIP